MVSGAFKSGGRGFELGHCDRIFFPIQSYWLEAFGLATHATKDSLMREY